MRRNHRPILAIFATFASLSIVQAQFPIPRPFASQPYATPANMPTYALGQPLDPINVGPTSSEAGVVNEAAAVLHELASGTATQIPENLLASAEGVAIVPHYVRGAFVIGVAGGRGVLLTRDADHRWLAPEFIRVGGGSIGWQAGIESVDLVMVFRSPRSLNNIRQGKLTLGVNASAAAGPVGRYASAATDAHAQAEIFTYSKSRGLFAGVALDGANLQLDIPATQVYYQTLGGGLGVVPPSAIGLVDELNRYATVVSPVQPAGIGVDTDVATANPLSQADTSFAAAKIPVPVGGLTQLERSVAGMMTKVDTQWQSYLALPADWQNAAELSATEVRSTLMRYERVATNPQFAALRSLPEFSDSLAFLRDLAAQADKSQTLSLPPPPVPEGEVSRGRY